MIRYNEMLRLIQVTGLLVTSDCSVAEPLLGSSSLAQSPLLFCVSGDFQKYYVKDYSTAEM